MKSLERLTVFDVAGEAMDAKPVPPTEKAKAPKMSATTVAVLNMFLLQPQVRLYGGQLTKELGVEGGTIYPLLNRLANYGWLAKEREKPFSQQAGRPARVFYRLVTDKVEEIQAKVMAASERKPGSGTRQGVVTSTEASATQPSPRQARVRLTTNMKVTRQILHGHRRQQVAGHPKHAR